MHGCCCASLALRLVWRAMTRRRLGALPAGIRAGAADAGTYALRGARQAGAAAGLPAFPLRQPERAEGRRGRRSPRSAPSTASIRSSCAAPPRRLRGALGHPAGRLRLRLLGRTCLGEPADLLGRRGRRRLRPSGADDRGAAPTSMWVAFESAARRRNSPTARRSPPRTSPGPSTPCSTQGRPSLSASSIADVKDVAVEGPRRVVFHFKTNANRELPLILGGLPVLPKHWFEGRDFTSPLTDAPIGSGPYRIDAFRTRPHASPSSAIPNWWAANLPTGMRHQQFRPRAHRIFPRRDRGDGGVQGRADRLPQREHRQELGHRLRLSRRCRSGLVIKERVPPPSADRHAGLRDEHAPPGVRRPRGCARRWR